MSTYGHIFLLNLKLRAKFTVKNRKYIALITD